VWNAKDTGQPFRWSKSNALVKYLSPVQNVVEPNTSMRLCRLDVSPVEELDSKNPKNPKRTKEPIESKITR